MDDIDETLRRTVDAVDRYRVPERLIGIAATSLEQMTEQQRRAAIVAALLDGLLHIADQHAGPHNDCPSCHSISNGLAVALGVIRAEVDISFENRI